MSQRGPLLVAAVAVLGISLLVYGLASHGEAPSVAAAQEPAARPDFNGERAYDYLKKICEIGPRPSGSRGMLAQQKMVAEHFKALGGEVLFQNFRTRHPLDGSPVNMANLIVRWHPEAKERILLCAHYDTRPYPDRDPVDPRGVFIGANDGAGGVALLMEMGNRISEVKGPVGVDFCLFDAEEFVFNQRDPYFLGSEYFARRYVADRPEFMYRWAVLLDMIADADLQIYQERNSLSWRESRPLIKSIWATAARLGVREFVAQRGHEVRDDHLPLRNIGKIPACDVIDFDYPYWHTREDVPANCSAESLAKVGWVILEWLKAEVASQ